MDHIQTPAEFFFLLNACGVSLTLQCAWGGGNGLNGEQSLDRGQEGGAERERVREVGLITVPSAFVLRRIRQPCLTAIL